MPATDTIDFEREFEELVRELRALPTAAPEALRGRVRALGEPAPRRSLPTLPWRRSVLVLAPVCVLGLVVAAVVHGVVNSAPRTTTLSLATQGEAGGTTKTDTHFGAAVDAPPALRSPLVPPDAGERRQDYE